MSDENSPPPTPASPSARRASFSPGQKISEFLGRSTNNNGSGPPLYPSPIATAAANAQAQQRRRMSITSLGLSGSPTQTSAFVSARARQESFSSGTSQSTSIDENVIEDGDAPQNGSPNSPFARRMSFGARALRDVKTGTGNGNGTSSHAFGFFLIYWWTSFIVRQHNHNKLEKMHLISFCYFRRRFQLVWATQIQSREIFIHYRSSNFYYLGSVRPWSPKGYQLIICRPTYQRDAK